MICNKKILGLIPARGGSKRLPQKNLLNLAGKPLIAWTIEAALKSKFIDHVVVSSEDKRLLKIAKRYGADVPFRRPVELSKDKSLSIDVAIHAINFFGNLGFLYDYIVLLQPTSPLRQSVHIDNAFELLKSKEADAIISVCQVEHPISWSNVLPDDLSLQGFLSHDSENGRSQDCQINYRLNGAIYICKISELLKSRNFFLSSNIYAYIMDISASIDIDNQLDFDFASFLMKKNNKLSIAV